MVVPIVKRCSDEALAEPIVMALTIAGAACDRAGIPHIGFRDFVDDYPEARAIGAELTGGRSVHPDVPTDEAVAYHGVSYLDLVREVGAEEAATRFESDGRAAFRPVGFLKHVIQEVRPDLVVATNSPRSERAAIEAATQLGVPSCCLLDVFGIQEEWVMRPGFADRLCVLNDAVKRMAVARGRHPDEVVVTGNPAFDELDGVRSRRLHAPDRPASRLRVLWAAHPEPEVHPRDRTKMGNIELPDRIAKTLVQCATTHPEWEIIVRPHPTQVDLRLDGPSNIRVCGSDGLGDQLVWADVVVTVASTVGLQAALVGLPVVAIGGSVISADVPLADYELATPTTVDDLESTLEKISQRPERAAVETQSVGGATDRVIDVLLSLCDT